MRFPEAKKEWLVLASRTSDNLSGEQQINGWFMGCFHVEEGSYLGLRNEGLHIQT